MAKKILIVEDEKDILELLRTIFSDQKDYDICCAEDGQEALDTVYSLRPDIVILDVNLPVLSGDKLCKRVKADPAMKHVKILMLSGKAQRCDYLKAKEEGADDFITKPFRAKELLDSVKILARVD